MTDPALLPNGSISFLRHAPFDFETNLDRFGASQRRQQPEIFRRIFWMINGFQLHWCSAKNQL
jgi:hypothetical protein